MVSNAAVYDFEPAAKKMRIKTLHPGVSKELCRMASGFDFLEPGGDIPVTEMPSPEVLELLRNEVDPGGVFTKIPGM